jgi:hypothetical protein
VHSPDKPRTHSCYEIAVQHFERILRKKKFIEAIARADIDDCKTARRTEESQQHKGSIIAPYDQFRNKRSPHVFLFPDKRARHPHGKPLRALLDAKLKKMSPADRQRFMEMIGMAVSSWLRRHHPRHFGMS